jgi:hypothetical protein
MTLLSSVSPQRRRRRKGSYAGPVLGTLFMVVIPFVASVRAFLLVVPSHAQGERSAYVQAHGVRQAGTVLNVTNTVVDNDNGTTVAQVVVRLRVPVGGQDVTTASVPSEVTTPDGGTVTVLVDPQDPGYAEYPGMPYSAPNDWLILAIAGPALGAVGIGFLYLIWVPKTLCSQRE